MNILKALLLILTFTTFISCSRDEDTPAPHVEQPPAIAGEWKLEEYNYTRTTRITKDEKEHSTIYDAIAKDMDVILKIDTEANFYNIEGNYILQISTTKNGEPAVTEIDVKNLSISGNFVTDGYWFGTVENTTGFPGFPEPGEINLMNFSNFIIEDLTETRLELAFSEAHSFEDNEMPVLIIRVGRQVYKRL